MAASLQATVDKDVEAQLYVALFYFENGKYQESMIWYKMAAEQGNLEAMCTLFRMHEYGLGGTVNLVQGCYWMKKMLETAGDHPDDETVGDGDYKYGIGRKYLGEAMSGYGWYLMGARTNKDKPPQQSLPESMLDIEAGLRCLEKAGDLGHVEAVSQLGNIYMCGNPMLKVDPDIPKGIEFFKKAVEMGKGECAFQLAMVYRCGLVPTNEHLEKKWLEVAVALGHAEAKEALHDFRRKLNSSDATRRLNKLDKETDIEEYLTTNETMECSNPGCTKEEEKAGDFSLCEECKQVKYCSRKCQKAHWHLAHKRDCKELKKEKKSLIEDNRNIAFPYANRCFCCESKDSREASRKCKQCKNAWYCSRECQIKDWRSGHKKQCLQSVAELKDAERILAKIKMGSATAG